MVSKNNLHLKQTKTADQTPHYGLRKLSVGVASVLLSTTLYLGVTAQADTLPTGDESQSPATSSVADSSSSSAGTLTIAQSAGSTADTQETTDSTASQVNSTATSQSSESTVSASPVSEPVTNDQNTSASPVASSADQTAEPAVNTVSVSDSATTTLDLSSSAADLVTDSALTTSLATSTAAKTTVEFVDDDNNGAVVGTPTVLSGYAGDADAVSMALPTNYKLVSGQTIPTSVTLSGADDTVQIHLKHQIQTIADDDPMNHTSFQVTVHYKKSDATNTFMPDTVITTKYKRTTTKDLVTGKYTATPFVFESISQTGTKIDGLGTPAEGVIKDVPAGWQYFTYSIPYNVSVPGWHPTYSGTSFTDMIAIAAGTSAAMKTAKLTAIYAANTQTTHIKYVDTNGTVVKTDTISGKTDTTQTVNSTVPTGWKMTTPQTIPTSVTFDDDGVPDTTITIEHNHVAVTHDNPQTTGTQIPNGATTAKFKDVGQNDLNKTVTRTVTITNPDGTAKTTKQTFTSTRDAVVDMVDGSVVYGKWTKGQWDAVDVPVIKHYTASQTSVPAQTVDGSMSDTTVNVTYTVNTETVTVQWVDDTENGKVVYSTNVSLQPGKKMSVWIFGLDDTGHASTDAVALSGMYDLVGVSDTNVLQLYGTGYYDVFNLTMPSVDNWIDGNTYTVHLTHKIAKTDGYSSPTKVALRTTNSERYPNLMYTDDAALSKTHKDVTRTITIVKPDGSQSTTTQKLAFSRQAQYDMVTGEFKGYTDWKEGTQTFTAYTPSVIAGYTAETAPMATATGDSDNSAITVHYTANPQTAKIVYADKNGNTVKTDTVNGVTSQTVDTNSTVPTGWKLVDGQTIPTTIKLSANTPDTKVIVEHDHVTITPDNPQTDGTDIPNGTAQFKGVSENDLNQTRTRTITVNDPRAGVKTITQTAKISRNATVDMVDGSVVYGDWSTAQWPEYVVPTVEHYTASQASVPEQTVDGSTADTTVNVTYTANAETVTVQWVDDTENGKVIYSTNVSLQPGKIEAVWIFGLDDAGYNSTDAVALRDMYDLAGISDSDVLKPWPWSPDYYDVFNLTMPSVDNWIDGNTYTVHLTHKIVKTDGYSSPTQVALRTTNSERYPNLMYTDDAALSKTHKNVTRTITVVGPDGSQSTTTQKLTFSRQAQYDMVTGEFKGYTDWEEGTQTFTAYTPSEILGYTAETAPSATATGDSDNSAITLHYTADPQTAKIVYIDTDGNTVKTDTVNGVTDQTVDTNSTVPTGWKLVDGQTIPTTIKLGVNTPDTIVKVEHDHVSVNHDNPQIDGTNIPNGAAQFKGVSENDLNQTLTRTITINDPHAGTKTITQTAKISRDATVDMVDGSVVYGDWSTAQWPEYSAPTIDGYTPSQKIVEAKMVTNGDQDVAVTINYTADKQTAKIVYVDKNGTTVKTDTVNGVTDQTVDTNSTVPTGWKLVDGQTIPTTIKLGINTPDTIVKVEHDHVSINHDNPQTDGTNIPNGVAQFKGVSENDLNQTLTRTITVNDPHAGTKTITQTAKIYRDATVDMVDGSVVCGDWSTAQWPEYSVPTVDGYTPSQKTVEAKTVTNGDYNDNVTVDYTANAQTAKIIYTDENGTPVKADTVNGVTDQTVDTNSTVPTGWKLVDGQTIPTTIKLGVNTPDTVVKVEHDHVLISHGNPQIDGTNIPNGVAQFKGVSENDLNQTLTRTITINDPHAGTKTITQTAKISRDATVDMVDGSVVYGDWSTAEWPEYFAPTVDGYTPSQKIIEAKAVTDGDKDVAVTINYMADKQTAKIVYTDADDNPVKTDTVEGVTDQIVDANSTVPTGWKLVDGQTIPTTIKLGVNTPDTVIKIQHDHVSINHDKPQANGTDIPGGTAKFNGVADNDLNQTLTRTITVNNPYEGTKTITQTAKIYRDAVVDMVDGSVEYGEWSTTEWPEYTVPTVDGYTPSQAVVEKKTVANGDKDAAVTINYTADSQTAKIVYVDENGKSVKTDTINGTTDQDAKVNSSVPAGWKLIDGQTVPVTIKLGVNTPDTVVKVQHAHVTVTPDAPKTVNDKLPDNADKTFPSGAAHDDLNQTFERTITIAKPDGTTNTVHQTAHFTRTADVDEVSGAVAYSDWTTMDRFDSYVVPAIPGYTASQVAIAQSTPIFGDNPIVEINYTANAQTAKIVYVDENGNVIKANTVNGVTDQTVDTNSSVPTGWKLVDGQTIPTTIKLGVNTPDTVVKIQHDHVSINHDKPQADGSNIPGGTAKFSGVSDNDLNQALTRTITINDPYAGAKTIMQTAKISRNATVDMVDGSVKYSDWSTAEWPAYTVPTVDGYTPSQATVESKAVADGDKDDVVTIDYKADKQTAKIVYVDENGNVVKADTVSGKTDQIVDVNSSVPVGWELADGQTMPVKIKLNVNTPDTIVKVEHNHVSINYDKPQTDGTSIPGGAAEFKGVADNDLNQTLTRTIIVKMPNGQTKALAQTAKLYRDAVVDMVDGTVKYGDWSTTQWNEYTAPVVDGYTPSQAVVEAESVVNGMQNKLVTIDYTANDGTQTINYVDEDGNVIVNQTIHGKTDQEIAVNDDKPHGWVLENGQTVPGTVTIKAVDEPITVKIKHGIVAVAPDAPKTNADRMPNWPDKRYPAGVGYDDLNKTVTRTITFELPDGQTKTIKQTTTFTRHATVDEVTNAVVYSAWNEQSHTFDAVDVPTIDGWTASVEQVDGTVVTPDSEDEQVTVAYTANPTAPKSEDKSADTPGQSEGTADTANGSANTVFNESTTIQENDKTDSQAKANSQAKTDELPQTGNEQTNLQALAGLAMTGLAAMLGLGRKKRKNS